jgi:hypothetical protein
MTGEDNLQRMKMLDDAWNAQNWEVFRKRHPAGLALACEEPMPSSATFSTIRGSALRCT